MEVEEREGKVYLMGSRWTSLKRCLSINGNVSIEFQRKRKEENILVQTAVNSNVKGYYILMSSKTQ